MKHITPPAKESVYYTASDLRRVIDQLGFAVAFPRGFSMRPLIWQGDHYVVIVKQEGMPNIGDILAFEQIRGDKTAYIIHRLVAIDNVDGTTIYVMRGDNCIGCERIRQEDIIGRVTEMHRHSRWKPWHIVHKQHFTMEDKAYLRYSKFWQRCWKLRKPVYKLKVFLAKVKHKLT